MKLAKQSLHSNVTPLRLDNSAYPELTAAMTRANEAAVSLHSSHNILQAEL